MVRFPVILITSSDPENGGFGTGFVIHKDQSSTFVLTCEHVITQVGGAELVKVETLKAEVISQRSSSGLDMAVLKVDKLLDLPVLGLSSGGGERGHTFSTVGFQIFDRSFMATEISGSFGRDVELQLRDQANRTKGWDLDIVDQINLERGYSGAPVIDKASGEVVAIVTHRIGEGTRGLGISVAALPEIWPDMPPALLEETEAPVTVASGRRTSYVPTLLPYLCDRSAQEDRLDSALQKHKKGPLLQRPLICIVHGNEQESHDKFKERLLRQTFPRCLEIDLEIQDYLLKWPGYFETEEDALEIFQRNLSERVLNYRGGSIEKISQVLSQNESPAFIYSYVSNDRWQLDGPGLTNAFIEFWNRFPDLPPGPHVIACLFLIHRARAIESRENAMFYLHNLSFSKYEKVNGVVLPELTAVPQEDAERWLLDDRVFSGFCNKHDPYFCDTDRSLKDIRTFYKRLHAEESIEPRIPMDSLADRLAKIINKRRC